MTTIALTYLLHYTFKFLVYLCECVCVCAHAWAWKPEGGTGYALLFTLFPSQESSIKPGAGLVVSRPQHPLVSPYHNTGSYRNSWPYLAFYVDSRDLNSGPHAWAASSSTNWTISQCLCYSFIIILLNYSTLLCVLEWMRMGPICSYVWTLGPQLVELFGLVGGGVSLGTALRFNKSLPLPASSLPPLQCHGYLPTATLPTMMAMDTLEPNTSNYKFTFVSCLDHGVLW